MRIYNINAMRDLMEEPPKGQRLYKFFEGDLTLLSKDQVEDLRKLAESEFNLLNQFLDGATYD